MVVIVTKWTMTMKVVTIAMAKCATLIRGAMQEIEEDVDVGCAGRVVGLRCAASARAQARREAGQCKHRANPIHCRPCHCTALKQIPASPCPNQALHLTCLTGGAVMVMVAEEEECI